MNFFKEFAIFALVMLVWGCVIAGLIALDKWRGSDHGTVSVVNSDQRSIPGALSCPGALGDGISITCRTNSVTFSERFDGEYPYRSVLGGGLRCPGGGPLVNDGFRLMCAESLLEPELRQDDLK